MSMQRCCPPSEIVERDFEPSAAAFKALADPHRLTILATLAAVNGEVCVCDFTEALPLNQPAVSHHLRILRDAGFIACQRRGTWVYYRLEPAARERVRAAFDSVFDQKVFA